MVQANYLLVARDSVKTWFRDEFANLCEDVVLTGERQQLRVVP